MMDGGDELVRALRTVWKVDSFRPCQKEALECALAGRDCLVLLPTGGGKSLCYALYSVVAKKTVVVVSPLISLMMDQVKAMTQKGITATFLGSAQENTSEVSEAIKGNMQVVFVTPEKMVSMTSCPIPNVGLIAVDEAHCTSEWGCDFRPEYGQLKCMRKLFGVTVPVMALTASATPDVQDHIVRVLGMRSPEKLQTSFDRPNLRFSALQRPKTDAATVLSSELRRGDGARLPAIIYVPNVKDIPGRPGVETIALQLKGMGHRVEWYHGQMPSEERARRQHSFVVLGEADVMVATLAFGMGIDKPNVRLVLHWGACKSIESYFQQAGRAGRDGRDAECVLYYGASDWQMLFRMAKTGHTGMSQSAIDAATRRAGQMRQYCETSECRRRFLVRHFGESVLWLKCGMCDNSVFTAPKDEDLVDYTVQADAVLLAVRENEKHQFSLTRLTSLLLGDVTHEWMKALPGHNALQDVPATFLRGLIDRMASKGLLERVDVKIQGYNPFQSFVAADREPSRPILLPRVGNPGKRAAPTTTALYGEDIRNLETLKRLRTMLSQEKPAYTVATNEELSAVVRARPKTLEQLQSIPGFGPVKVAKYGKEILETVRTFA